MTTYINDVTAYMNGVEKYILTGAIPTVRSVRWTATKSTPYTTGDCVYLPTPNAGASRDEYILQQYKNEHELGHEDAVNAKPHWKSEMVRMKATEYGKSATFNMVANILSDYVQERNRIGSHAGRDQILLEGRAIFSRDELAPQANKPNVSVIGMAMFTLDNEYRRAWNPHLAELPKHRDTVTAGNVAHAVGVIRACGEWDTLTNEGDVTMLAILIHDALKQDAESSADDQPQPDVGEGEDDQPQPDVGEGEDEDKDEDKDEDDQPEPEADAEKQAEEMMESLGMHASGSGRKPEETGRTCPPTGELEFRQRKGMTLSQANRELGRGVSPPSTRTMDKVANELTHVRSFGSKLRTFFMARAKTRRLVGNRTGSLDRSRLTSAYVGRTDVFTQRTEAVQVNAAVSILLDCSGSMAHESMFVQASAAALAAAEALDGLKCNVELVGFTDLHGFGMSDQNGLVHHHIKAYGERFNRSKSLVEIGTLANELANNADGENLAIAYADIVKRPEQRKVILILSDGEPSTHTKSGDGWTTKRKGIDLPICEYTRRVIKQIDADPNVTLLAVGFGEFNNGSVGYTNATKLKDVSDLSTTLLDMLKQVL